MDILNQIKDQLPSTTTQIVIVLITGVVLLSLNSFVNKLVKLANGKEVLQSKLYKKTNFYLILLLILGVVTYKSASVLFFTVAFVWLAIKFVLFQKEVRDSLLKGIDRAIIVKKPNTILGKVELSNLAITLETLMKNKKQVTYVIARESFLGELEIQGISLGKVVITPNSLLGLSKGFTDGAFLIRDNSLVAGNIPLADYTIKDLSGVEEGEVEVGRLVGLIKTYDAIGIHISGITGRLSLMGQLKGELRTYLGIPLTEEDLTTGVNTQDIEQLLLQLLNISSKNEDLYEKRKDLERKKLERENDKTRKDAGRKSDLERAREQRIKEKQRKERKKR